MNLNGEIFNHEVFSLSNIKFEVISNIIDIETKKSVIGHTGGSSNILAVCAGIICLNNKRAFKTLGTKDVSEDCKIRLLLNHTKIQGNYIMINGFAFGGNNASIIIKSYTGSTT